MPEPLTLLFLDVDGVMNGHQRQENGYCGIDPACVVRLNRILAEVPAAKLVISSSWRYLVLNGSMTLQGFENLLLTHGLNVYGRLHGITASDEGFFPAVATDELKERLGTQVRAQQIGLYVRQHSPHRWAVLDDLLVPVCPLRCLVSPDGTRGLQDSEADRVAALLRGDSHA